MAAVRMFYYALYLVTIGMLNLVQRLRFEAVYLVQRLGTGWTVWCSIYTGRNRFYFLHARPQRPWVPTKSRVQWARRHFPRGKVAMAWRWPLTVIYRGDVGLVELYFTPNSVLPFAFYRDTFTFREREREIINVRIYQLSHPRHAAYPSVESARTVSSAITLQLPSCETSCFRKSRNKNSRVYGRNRAPASSQWSLKSCNNQYAHTKVHVTQTAFTFHQSSCSYSR